MRRRLVSSVALVAGLVAVVAGVLLLSTSAGSSGSVVVQSGFVPSGSVPSGSVPTLAAGNASAEPSPPVRALPETSRSAGSGSPSLPGPPVNVAVPSLGLTASVFPVGVEGSGAVAIPADVATAGWVVTTSRPGTTGGTATLVGHVDDATGRYGVFHRLYAAKVGQQITVRTSTGQALRYVIHGVRLYPRDDLPRDLFASTGSPRLALVTCAGAYSRAHGGFPDNLVVWATPA